MSNTRLVVGALAILALVVAGATFLMWDDSGSGAGPLPPGPSTAERTDLGTAGTPPAPVVMKPACVGPGPVDVRHGGLLPFLRSIGGAFVGSALAQDVTPEDPEKNPRKVSGDVHMTTMTGARYDFQAVGEFVALKTDTLEVQARLQPWGSSRSVSVLTALAINVAGDIVAIYANDPSPVRLNHQPASATGELVRLPHGGTMQRQGNGIVITWPGQSELRVVYGSYLDYIVTLCKPDIGHVQGLMGFDPDHMKEPILVARGGTAVSLSNLAPDAFYDALYHRFGNSWRIRQGDSLFDYAQGQSTRTFTDLNFPYQPDPIAGATDAQKKEAESACRRAGLSDLRALEECILDVLATGLAAFADNNALTDSLFTKTRLAQRGSGSWQCSGPAGATGWECAVHSLVGAEVGAMVTFELETLQDGQPKVETLKCGPVTEARDAPCSDKTQGINFQGAKAVERFSLKSGESWQLHSTSTCTPAKPAGQPC